MRRRAITLLLIVLAVPAAADDYPRLSGLSYGRLQFERMYRSDDPARATAGPAEAKVGAARFTARSYRSAARTN